jgi:hypothetical protein
MPKVHPPPTQGTAKELYAKALACGAPDCDEPLFVMRPGAHKRSLNSRMAHICARREGGPRWDPATGATENRSSGNLILLCVKHADAVDLAENVDLYPVELLRQWKSGQLASYDRAARGWTLSDDEAEEVVKASAVSPVGLYAETIFVGGIGGLAPGASGGGGEAIGTGAIVGPGGQVGRVRLDGAPGKLPGSGGGGGGVLAPGAIAPDTDDGSRATEGRGFSSGNDGQDGGESSFGSGEFMLRAPGAKGGLAGTGVRLSDDRLSVSTLMLVNYAECRHGFVSIVGGGWQSYSVLNVPATGCSLS